MRRGRGDRGDGLLQDRDGGRGLVLHVDLHPVSSRSLSGNMFRSTIGSTKTRLLHKKLRVQEAQRLRGATAGHDELILGRPSLDGTKKRTQFEGATAPEGATAGQGREGACLQGAVRSLNGAEVKLLHPSRAAGGEGRPHSLLGRAPAEAVLQAVEARPVLL